MFLKRFSLRTLFSLTPSSLPSPYSIFIAQCFSSSPPHLTYPRSHSHPDPRNVRVSVWWDLDKCPVPPGVNVFRGAQAITAAIESSGIKGPIQITAFGDMFRLARTNREALSNREVLSSTPINLSHIPHDENSAISSISRDLTRWVSLNPPPAHLFLIIDDEYCGSMLHELSITRYNVLLAIKQPAPPLILCAAATLIWNWDALVKGENLIGRYFNRPPISPWYDDYDRPLEEPESPEEPLPEVFSQDSFWRDLRTFLNTERGSFIIEESDTRKKLAYYLQKYGPSVLKSLTHSDVLLMLDVLISEKGWLNEIPGVKSPFILLSAAVITSANS